nr:ABC transporter permease [Neobacillus sp. Marseille-Q6967]
MNIFLKEMKSHRNSLIIWSVSMFLMVASGMGKYVSLASIGQPMNEMLAGIPKSVRAILGIGEFDISSPSGYYGLLFIYMLLLATVHAAMLGATIIAKEERDKTTEFLFVKPVSRTHIITAKLTAAFINLVILNVVTFLSSIILIGKYAGGKMPAGDIGMMMAGMFILQMLFMVIGSSLAAVKRKPKTAASLAAGILLLMYILSVAIDLNGKIEPLKYLTPFKYFEVKNVMNGGLDSIYLMLSAAIIAVLIFLTFRFYKKRDLNV